MHPVNILQWTGGTVRLRRGRRKRLDEGSIVDGKVLRVCRFFAAELHGVGWSPHTMFDVDERILGILDGWAHMDARPSRERGACSPRHSFRVGQISRRRRVNAPP